MTVLRESASWFHIVATRKACKCAMPLLTLTLVCKTDLKERQVPLCGSYVHLAVRDVNVMNVFLTNDVRLTASCGRIQYIKFGTKKTR